jgi:hypothetical protein
MAAPISLGARLTEQLSTLSLTKPASGLLQSASLQN